MGSCAQIDIPHNASTGESSVQTNSLSLDPCLLTFPSRLLFTNQKKALGTSALTQSKRGGPLDTTLQQRGSKSLSVTTMGLGDCIQNEVTPLRKKGSFDVAFLTGQSEERESVHHSEESCSATSSSDSSIDIVTTTNNNDRKKRKRKASNPVTLPNIDIDKHTKTEPPRSFHTELVVPQLTSPFHFLPHFKTVVSPFGPPFTVTPVPPLLSSSTVTTPKNRRLYGHSSSDPPYYPPYHPFLAPPLEVATTNPPPSQSTNHSPPIPSPTLLPPSLAALSLPAQNVCAKCKIGFRMTSDLVYHMRSHHKRETDPQQKRREEKLKCTVCHETFRERHHLTRHMTAHQDREEELELRLGKG